ncbi:MAG: acyl-CoA dehydrogenase [Betaproteobacteria bacterium]|nr:acyl-CoA dehydrogenase [Betaproteobacteria bacterium]
MSGHQQDLVDAIDQIFERECDRQVREKAEEGSFPSALWETLEAVGVTRATLPESAGGPGLDFSDAMLALRRTAYHALPAPLAETLLAIRMAARAGLPVPTGPATVAPVRANERLQAEESGGKLLLSGRVTRVPWGDLCASAVLAFEHQRDSWIAVVPLAGMAMTTERNLAGEPRSSIVFDRQPVTTCARLDDAANLLCTEGALFRSVQMLGALERILELSIGYARERIQFGKPIASFQAVQHLLAVMAGEVSAASAAVSAAIRAVSAAPDRADQANHWPVAIAKSRVGEAAGKAADIAHQVHAAMGFTREHSLHYSTRRLWAWRDEFGSETHWQTRLGRMVSANGPEALWPMLTGQP